MGKGVVEIPVEVLSSVETLDELQDWLTAQNPQIIDELREARRQDLAGEFKLWEPRHLQRQTNQAHTRVGNPEKLQASAGQKTLSPWHCTVSG